MRFLFFVEREFHISLFANLMILIKNDNLGEIGIFSSKYNNNSHKNSFGSRLFILNKYLDFEPKLIVDPFGYSPDFTFIADSSYEKVEGLGRIISIGHGTISKGSFYTNSPLTIRENCADLIFVPGKIHQEILQRQIKTPVYVSGIPKLDNLTKSINRNQILKKMNLDCNKKTILIAPTFNPEFSLLPFLLKDGRLTNEYNYLFKLHGVESEENLQKVKDFCSKNSNAIYFDSYDITLAMQVADILFSDVSSVIYEFTALDKPIILFDSKYQQEFKKYNPTDLEHHFRSIGIRINDINRLEKAIKVSLIDDPYKVNRNKVKKMFIKFSKNYSAAKFIVDNILNHKFEKKANIILLKGKNYRYLHKLYSNRFNLYPIKSRSEIEKVINKIQKGNIIFIDGNFNYSANYPNLTDAILEDKQNEIIAPLLTDSTNENQNIEFYFPVTKNMDNKQIAQSISYQKPGDLKKIKKILNISLGFSLKLARSLYKIDFENKEILSNEKIKTCVMLFNYTYEK